VVLYVFGLVFPANVILGNWRFNPIEAAIYAGFWVTFFIWVLWDFAMAKGIRFDSATVILGYFWSVNIFAFWIISRFSQYAGFGITNYLWAFAIGLGAYIVQRLAWGLIVGKKAA
jgi:hypothetical protein